MFNFKKDKKIYKKGFTIIEALVAITILVIAVTGPLTLASRGLSYSQYAKDEITAFYLANEAIDSVRNLRDGYIRFPEADRNWYGQKTDGSGSVIDSGLLKCDNKPCYFDVWRNPLNFKQSFDDINPQIPQTTDFTILEGVTVDGLRVYGKDFNTLNNPTTNPSIFSRMIIVKPVPANLTGDPDQIRVTAVVTWTARNGIERNVILSENLFNIPF